MPIYEFKCLECEEFFELLVMGSDDDKEIACPKCEKINFERVLSTTNYNMGSSSSAPSGGGGPQGGCGGGASVQERTCSGGSCSTYNIPGPA